MRTRSKPQCTSLDKINHYYQSTNEDYQELWTGESDLAIHFGFDDGSPQTHSESLIKMNFFLAQLTSISSQDCVLDAGCGFGGSSLWLADNLGCHVEGVNIVNEQLEVGRYTAKSRGLNHLVSFSCQNYLSTTFADGFFSVIWALETLCHNRDKDTFLDEAYRLLNKNGRLLIAEFVISDEFALQPVIRDRFRVVETGWALAETLTLGEYLGFCTNAGFTDIQSHDLTKHVRGSLKRLGELCRGALPHARMNFENGTWNRERFENVEASIKLDDLVDEEMAKYVAIVAKKSEQIETF